MFCLQAHFIIHKGRDHFIARPELPLKVQYNRPVTCNRYTGVIDRQLACPTFLLPNRRNPIFERELEIGITESNLGRFVLQAVDDDHLYLDAV